jgi:chromosome condensin MukBEF ATPase and DNA-binding subunit MukB
MRISQIVISSDLKYSKIVYAFTEQGVAMISGILNSDRAIEVNVAIMRTFVQLRNILASHEDLARKLNELEKKYDEQFSIVFDAIRQIMTPPVQAKKKIGFHVEEKKSEYRVKTKQRQAPIHHAQR